MKIKVCGVTRAEDAALIGARGATHIGCVLSPESSRAVRPEDAREIFAAAGKKVTGVIVVRSGTADAILELAKLAGTKTVQLEESARSEAAKLEAKGLTLLRRAEVSPNANALPHPQPAASQKSQVLLQCTQLGTGLTFPWELLGSEAPAYTWIGGGVSPENVRALLTHAPFGMNICSALEFRPGVMDQDRIELLFEAIDRDLSAL